MRKVFLNLGLFLALGLTTAMFYSCEEDDYDYEEEREELLPLDWVEINGVKWATRNVLATKPEEHYWNSYYSWKDAGWACSSYNREGEKWRLPTIAEFRKLLDSGNTLTTLNGVLGRQFGSGDNTIFLPATGYGGRLYIPGVNTGYWSSRQYLMRVESFGNEQVKEFASFLHFSEEVQDDILVDDIETIDIQLAVRCVCELE